MKRTVEGARAHELEIICVEGGTKGADEQGAHAFSNRKLYVVEDQSGLYRRVPAHKASERPKEHVVAYFQGALIELVRVPYIEKELHEAGFYPADLALVISEAARDTGDYLNKALFQAAFPRKEDGDQGVHQDEGGLFPTMPLLTGEGLDEKVEHVDPTDEDDDGLTASA